MGAMVQTLDAGRMDVSDVWNRVGKFLGILRTWMGRVVVLGSG